jgi:tetratricopeptide (TPR) repeat protein
MATTLAVAGDLTRAASVGERAAAVLPSDTVVLTNLGDAYLQQGNIDKAIAILKRALTINPDLPDATVYLGLVSVREGDLAAGESLFRSAINLQPDLAAAHNDLASVLTGQGHYREAEFHLQKAVEINPADPQVRHNYGMFLVRTGSPDKALIELREAAPGIGICSVPAGSWGFVGEREFRAAIAQDSENGEAHLRLGTLLTHDAREAEAQTHYKIAARSSDPRVRRAALNVLRQSIDQSP